jgi:two-component system NtrC family sensor kinase
MPQPLIDSTGFERISRELALRKRLQDSLLAFSRGVSARMGLETGLEALAAEVNGLFGTSHTSVWLHDRRGKTLRLAASSDPRETNGAARISTEDDSAIARGLRLNGPEISGRGAAQTLVAPLRGWRRALGTLVIEGAPTEVESGQLVELSIDLARQLSISLESVVVLEELIRQHRVLADTFDSLDDMVIVTDREDRTVQVNEALTSRIGATRRHLADLPMDTVLGSSVAQWVRSEGSAGGDPVTLEFTGHPLGAVISVTATPLVSERGEPAGRVVVLRDLSDQVSLRQRVAQAEKLASLGQFIAGIAHELSNPLQSVLGHLELMVQEKDHDAAHQKQLHRAFQDVDRAAKIVRNLLVFSGAQRVTRKRVDMDELLTRVIAARELGLQRTAVEIVREGEQELPPITGDVGQLEQVLMNVMLNAEQSIGEAAEGRITIFSAVESGRVRIVISDNGPGIPADVLPKIFDPFFTTKDAGKGTGLGLAITHGIVQDHGGTITAASDPNGATFTLQFPIAD